MRYSLINPPWSFESSIYFGCREPHLPLEYGYSKILLERAGHEVQVVDAQMDGLSLEQVRRAVTRFGPDLAVVTSAPSYLFWRCAPPELRIPQQTAQALRECGAKVIAVGPHASTTPRATIAKLGADAAVLGECEEILPLLAGRWDEVPSLAWSDEKGIRVNGSPHAANMGELPALRWEAATLARHTHHHHRFDTAADGPGAEMEASRGCPYHCTFCAKQNYRDTFRRRPLGVIREELDGLIANGARYVYFIDEIFLPFRDLLELLAEYRLPFGMQTRIDLWSREMIELAGRANCVSIEAGVESITEEGRSALDKRCKLSTDDISALLIHAKQHVPFVQANLLDSQYDDAAAVTRWREHLLANGVWANEPVPLFPYPGSPEYSRRWGVPDDRAWERAHEAYLNGFQHFSDVQDQNPVCLTQLEGVQPPRG